jgi:hypothetical protein
MLTGATSGATWGYLILGIMDIYAGWGYWGYLWGYLGLLAATSENRNPADHGYLCWLGLLGLPLGLPGATWGYL